MTTTSFRIEIGTPLQKGSHLSIQIPSSPSGISFNELHEITNPAQQKVRELVVDKPDIKIYRLCGELEHKGDCGVQS